MWLDSCSRIQFFGSTNGWLRASTAGRPGCHEGDAEDLEVADHRVQHVLLEVI